MAFVKKPLATTGHLLRFFETMRHLIRHWLQSPSQQSRRALVTRSGQDLERIAEKIML
jgi:hypothetical protein